jgi:uncharacterized membrane protein
MSRQRMWETLLHAVLSEGPVNEAGRLASPWYVKILLAFSGWLAALCLLGFVVVGFEYILDNNIATFIMGGMMIGVAFAILRVPKNEFIEHLALALSLAGQALAVFAISDDLDRTGTWLLVALLQVALTIAMRNFVHRVFSSFVAAIAFNMALLLWGGPDVVSSLVMLLTAWCLLNESRYPHQIIRATGYGMVLALILLEGTALFGYREMGLADTQYQTDFWFSSWIGELLISAVTLYVVWTLLRRYDQGIFAPVSITALLGTFLICALSIEAQGITVGMVIMLLGFAGANRVLLGLGVVSLIFYISSYYYLLDATLLAKSQTLLVVGVTLLSIRWLILTIFPARKEAEHA